MKPHVARRFYAVETTEAFALTDGRCGICGETYDCRVQHMVAKHEWWPPKSPPVSRGTPDLLDQELAMRFGDPNRRGKA